jgi:hypothetical protein
VPVTCKQFIDAIRKAVGNEIIINNTLITTVNSPPTHFTCCFNHSMYPLAAVKNYSTNLVNLQVKLVGRPKNIKINDPKATFDIDDGTSQFPCTHW